MNSYISISPENLEVHGTENGAKISWKIDNRTYRGFDIYRDGKKVNNTSLSSETREYEDKTNGAHRYEIRGLLWGNDGVAPSIALSCYAGNADKTAPQIVVISPPTSVLQGQPALIKARLLDNRSDELLTATLYYRTTGQTNWSKLLMTRKVKAVFTAAIPAPAIHAEGIEYYISASDGDNTSFFPADAPEQPLSLVQEKVLRSTTLTAPKLITENKSLKWQPIKGAFYFNIYRSKQKILQPILTHCFTYVAADATLNFTDNGKDLLDDPLKGVWYYRITAVDQYGYESQPSSIVPIKIEPMNKNFIIRVSGVASLGGLLFGFDTAIISGTIPYITAYFSLDEYMLGWAVSSILIGCAIGAMLAGTMADKYGRRFVLILCAVLFAVSGVGAGLSHELYLFVFYRLIGGLGVGAAAMVSPMYIAEIAPASWRGRLVAFYQLAIVFGILLAYFSNYIFDGWGADNWRWMFASQAAPSALFFLLLLIVPETPRWLIKKGRKK